MRQIGFKTKMMLIALYLAFIGGCGFIIWLWILKLSLFLLEVSQ